MSTQKREIEEASSKRQEEYERLVAEHRLVLDELSLAKAAKCEALVQIQVRTYSLEKNLSSQLKQIGSLTY